MDGAAPRLGGVWVVLVGATSGCQAPLVSSCSEVALPGVGGSPWGPSEPTGAGLGSIL